VYTADASLAGFSPGENVPIRDLFYGAALPSGADATSALAICSAGDEDAFAQLMNEKVKELGLTGTHFENASGLQGDNHYSTCYDMAMIIKYAMDNDFLRTVISTYQYTTASTEKHPDGLELESTMLSRLNGDEAAGFTIIGGKTGYTPNAGYCLASFGERNSDGAQFIMVTAKGSGRYTPIYDAIEAYGKYAVTSSDETDTASDAQ
jgi:D-alanyl-D-alanine carboxypeptidase (penicillin-binding protein 5/6)